MSEIDIQNTSGLGKGAELPNEIKRFNWGAFFLTWIWGVCNSAYLTLISLAFNIVVWCIGFFFIFIVSVMALASDAATGVLLLFGYPIIALLVELAIRIWFGVKGNQWAWQNKKWNSVEHFNRVQKQWVVGTAIALAVIFVAMFAYVGVIAAMVTPALISNTSAAKDSAMVKKSVSVLNQAALMNEALENPCGKSSSSSELAKCFSDRFNGNLVGNKMELSDGTDFIFHSGNRCKNDGTCYVIIDTTARARGSVKATIRLYSDEHGYIKVNKEDSTKLVEKYSSR